MKIIIRILFFTILIFNSLTAYCLTPLEVSTQIKLAILSDSKLSIDAKKIKITTYENAIVLEGHVESKAEKVQIENLTRARAGRKKVFNRLTY